MIYTTNAVESLHRSLRKIIKTRGSFPTDEVALKLLFLAIRNAGVHWRLAKGFEASLESALAWLFLASVKLLVRRLGRTTHANDAI